jgi:hypothetical protein
LGWHVLSVQWHCPSQLQFHETLTNVIVWSSLVFKASY